ncbi:MAG: cysteine--tRNA ligase [Pseudomonadota bacterium]
MSITLYNTATRRKEPFTPLDPNNVRMYVCGPTVYDRAHLGNARPVLIFDVLYRLLRHEYGADAVTYVRNFTDVDDRINETAQKRKQAGATGSLEDLIRERSDETIGWYHADMDALGALRPTHEPRATEYIDQMIAMSQQLINDGFAYAKDGHVLFRVRKYDDYGKLSGRSVDDMIAGARVEVAPYKEDPMDFVLWKPSDDDLPGWDSPWGRGRPGWHIECSAMADELLWKLPREKGLLSQEALAHPHTFDIHGGGNDLTFPHHENEIAQSKCVHQGSEYAQVWMHNEMLQVEGKKMSKSLGNFFTVRDLLDQGVPGEVIRFVMLSTHYRKPMDWTETKANIAELKLLEWHSEIKTHARLEDVNANCVSNEIVEALSNDLDTHNALKHLDDQVKTAGNASEKYQQLANDMQFLGLLSREMFSATGFFWVDADSLLSTDEQQLIAELIDARSTAKALKDFQRADEIREILLSAGVTLTDSRGGTTYKVEGVFDPSKLEALE